MTKYRLGLFMLAFACASICCTAVSASCATLPEPPNITSREIASAQSNPMYGAVLSLRWGQGPCCDSFSLNVANNTGRPLEILWDKTFYVHNGKRQGGFVFGQSACSVANLPQTSFIPPGGTLETAIWPEVLVHPGISPQTCGHLFLETGQDGIFLTVKGDGLQMSETVTLDLDFAHLFPQAG